MDGPFDEVTCERCGRAGPRAQTRRLFWLRVCIDCDGALRDRPLEATVAEEPDDDPLREAVGDALRRAVVPGFWLLAAGLLSRVWGERAASFVAGALAAEVLTWAIFSLLRAPFERLGYLVRLAVRLAALGLAQVPAIPGLDEAGRLDVGVVGFFLVLLGRAAWFGCWWLELVDEPDDDEDEGFERALSIGRPGSSVAPPSRRR